MANEQTHQNQSKTPVEERYEIRMKPGCGKLLIGRRWKTRDGIVDRRPENQNHIVDVLDEFLEPRALLADGTLSDGPKRIVPRSAIEAFLAPGSDKPARVIDGYPMKKVAASAPEIDESSGIHRGASEENWIPGVITRNRDGVLNAQHSDCPFEIVRKVS